MLAWNGLEHKSILNNFKISIILGLLACSYTVKDNIGITFKYLDEVKDFSILFIKGSVREAAILSNSLKGTVRGV